MITQEEYAIYLGVNTAPQNFKRLEYLALNELKSIMVENIPTANDLVYNDFKRAVMEQINYFDLNSDLIDSNGSSGYTLGSYSEGSSNQKDNFKSVSRISPVAYDILLNCGLLYCGLNGRC
mgnify:CR=1 FL=1